MAQPDKQIEVQLGHLCNNRCVFCVSGQLSELKRAPQLPVEPIARQIRDARAGGAEKITFLGGEPTIQRSFPELLQLAVDLDFDEICVFTNGVMTPRKSFRERVMAILDQLPDTKQRVVFRFSLQGGTRQAHDATTVNPGAFDRIVQSLEILHGEGFRLTGNMCVVTSNFESVPSLADMAKRFDFEDLHLDMVRPRDSGDRTDDYLRTIMSRYTDMAPSFTSLVRRAEAEIGPDFDINIGNLPFCTAPQIAHRIHHDGNFTITVAASGQGTTQEGFDKYTDKRSDKHKLPGCADCVFNDRCGGIFDKYALFYGHDEFAPVSAEQLYTIDAGLDPAVRGAHFVLLSQPAIEAVAAAHAELRIGRVDERAGEVDAALTVGASSTGDAEGQRWHLILRAPGRRSARQGWFNVRLGRLEAAVLGGRPAGAGALDTLGEVLVDIAARLGDEQAEALTERWRDVRAELEQAWRAEQERIAARRRQMARSRQRAVALAERLRGAALAGLEQTGYGPSDDRRYVELRYEGRTGGARGGEVVVRVDTWPTEDKARSPLSHEARGLGPDVLRAFSEALGQRLRGGTRQRTARAGQGAAATPAK